MATLWDRTKQAFEKTLHLIYTRYDENPDKKTFRNKVERMTLINMMLLFKKDLGLGSVCSNLYQLLIDLVRAILLLPGRSANEAPELPHDPTQST